MEEPVNILGGMLREVAVAQRESLARTNVLAQVRARGPMMGQLTVHSRSFASLRLPRMRFVLPTLAAVGALALWLGTREAPLSFAIGDPGADGKSSASFGSTGSVGDRLEAPADRGLPLHFSDGSLVALDRGARVQVTSLADRGATLQIEKGRADVNVHHRRHTRWQMRAGSFEVTVTGTRFSIDWDTKAEALTVVMTEGTVEVRGRDLRGRDLMGGSPIIVTAGQRFHATAREPRWTLAAASAPPEVVPVAPTADVGIVAGDVSSTVTAAAPPAEAPPAPTTPSVRAVAAAAPRSWQALARSGRYQEALETVEHTGFERACAKLGAEDLVQLGDAARLARNTARAEQAYRVALRRFPTVDRPAFALGLVAFEQRRDFRAAGRWFDLYLRQYPNGPLAREALGRQMESWHRASDPVRARRAAHAYLSQAPSGPYAPLARQIAAP